MINPTFFTHRLALISAQLTELQAIPPSRHTRLAREALRHRQAELAADINELSKLVDITHIPAVVNAGREVAA